MKTVGQILKSARLAKNLQVKDIAGELKIKAAYVESIESDDFSGFSSETYAWGFTRMYADFVGLREDDLLPFFRRTWNEKKGKNERMQINLIKDNTGNINFKPMEKNISKIMVIVGILVVLMLFIAYLYLQYQMNLLK